MLSKIKVGIVAATFATLSVGETWPASETHWRGVVKSLPLFFSLFEEGSPLYQVDRQKTEKVSSAIYRINNPLTEDSDFVASLAVAQEYFAVDSRLSRKQETWIQKNAFSGMLSAQTTGDQFLEAVLDRVSLKSDEELRKAGKSAEQISQFAEKIMPFLNDRSKVNAAVQDRLSRYFSQSTPISKYDLSQIDRMGEFLRSQGPYYRYLLALKNADLDYQVLNSKDGSPSPLRSLMETFAAFPDARSRAYVGLEAERLRKLLIKLPGKEALVKELEGLTKAVALAIIQSEGNIQDTNQQGDPEKMGFLALDGSVADPLGTLWAITSPRMSSEEKALVLAYQNRAKEEETLVTGKLDKLVMPPSLSRQEGESEGEWMAH